MAPGPIGSSWSTTSTLARDPYAADPHTGAPVYGPSRKERARLWEQERVRPTGATPEHMDGFAAHESAPDRRRSGRSRVELRKRIAERKAGR